MMLGHSVHFTHYVHPKPEILYTPRAPTQPQYDRNRFIQLAQLLSAGK